MELEALQKRFLELTAAFDQFASDVDQVVSDTITVHSADNGKVNEIVAVHARLFHARIQMETQMLATAHGVQWLKRIRDNVPGPSTVQ